MDHATEHTPPELVVRRQLDAFNARDLDAWAATYAADARQVEFPATLLAEGREAIRARTRPRMQDERLHARLTHRQVMGATVVDLETLTLTLPDGAVGEIDVACLYRVEQGLIRHATFVYGPRRIVVPLTPAASPA